MENNILKKKNFSEKLKDFFNQNKIKVYSFLTLLILSTILIIYINFYNEKQNSLISEKYIKAGLHLSKGNNEKSKKILEEIIYSKNKFYSVLALNTILEKNLELDKIKIINYFETLEQINISKERKDLIIFKKAMYLIKQNNIKAGTNLLNKLIIENSKFKTLADEIINN